MTSKKNNITWTLFLAFACLWLGLSYDRGFNLPDEGNAIYPAVRILDGDLPHRDYDTLYTGGGYYFNALLFSIFGIHAGLIRVVTAVTIGLLAILSVHLAARFVDGGWRFLPGIVFLLSFPLNPTSYHSWYAVLCGTAALMALLKYLDKGLPRYLLLAGLAAGGGFLAKQTMGAFSISALFGFLIWQFPFLPHHKNALWDRLLRALCLCITAIIFTIYLAPAWSISTHVGYLFLTPLWFLPLTLWFSGSADTETSLPSYPSLIRALGFVCAGTIIPIILYGFYFTWQGGLSTLLYGVFQFPGRYLDLWVSESRYPMLLDWVMNPLGTFLLCTIAPVWHLSHRFGKNRFLRFWLWPLLCLLLLLYPIRLIENGIAAWTSAASFLSWANYGLFFSVIYFLPIFIPWLTILMLLVEQLRPGSFMIPCHHRRAMGAIYLFHIYLLFCVYPMLHPFYLIYTMPTTFVMTAFVLHRLWRLTTPDQWLSDTWLTRGWHGLRLLMLLAVPIGTSMAFLIWGTQYWIGLKQLGDEGRITLDKRVHIPLPRVNWGFSLKPEEALPVEQVGQYIRTHTKPSDPVFVASKNGPLILFASERHTPSRIHFPLGPLSESDQKEIIAALERTQARYALFDWSFENATMLWQYINTGFSLNKEIGEYRIFIRQ